ncbi:MAG TPA: adenylate/guanylate cyclase domain-containing protein [Planctomycetaceae bacterium]
MSQRFTIRVYHRQRLDFSGEFDVAVELGRQRRPDEAPFVQQRDGQGWRVSIARLDELMISRRHIRLEPLPGNRVRVTNVSERNTIFLEDGGVIASQQSSELPLPLEMNFDEKSIRLDPAGAESFDEPEMHSLAYATLTPGSFDAVLPSAAQAMRSAPKEVAEAFVSWLAAVAGMLQSSSNSREFFRRAAKGLVDLIFLDTGAVLLREEASWNIAELTSTRPGVENGAWRPSSRILASVVAEKRTFWQVSGQSLMGTESLGGVQAVVASPVLNEAGEVVAVLYGDRVSRGEPAGSGLGDESGISKLEAMLVETFASSVAAGLARIEQERKTLAAQVRFEQFFTRELAGQLAVEPDLLRGRDTEVTILFCDIRGFSRISERIGPAATVEWVGSVLNMLSNCVMAQQGALIDYNGDELMAMWGAPARQPDHAQRACRTALDMWARLPELDARWQATLAEPTRFGIGINTGVARVGKTGSDVKFKYGPVGNTVNLASRVQGATKHLRANVLITAATRARLGAEHLTRHICRVNVVNISEAVDLYELMTETGTAAETLCRQYEAALREFHQENFRQAAKILGSILEDFPNDGPAVVLLSRVADQLLNPASEFNPAWELPGK